MPLLHRKEYVLSDPPENLDSDEEVFCCETTCEIFRDYEEFYQKTILYNSLVWTCEITGKANMTYREALESEKSAYRKIRKIPDVLKKPVFFLVSLVQRSKIDHVNDAIFSFIRDRFFVGETVEVTVGKVRRSECRILGFKTQSMNNGHIKESSDEDLPLVDAVPLKPNEIKYVVHFGKDEKSEKKIVTHTAIRRSHGALNRQLLRLLLKATCTKPTSNFSEAYQIKDDVMEKFDMSDCKWTDFFAGPQKHFVDPTTAKKKAANSSESRTNGGDGLSDDNEKLKAKKTNTINRKSTDNKDDKRREKELSKKKKAMELEKEKADKERKKLEREQELMQLKKEKELLRQQRAEQKRKEILQFREWAKPRDDLECDDLKVLPLPTELDLPIPAELFGDVIELLEFFCVFGKHFGLSYQAAQPVTCGKIIEALLSYDHNSPLCEFLFFFLTHLMSNESHDPEGYERINVENSDRDLAKTLKDDVREETLVAACTLAASWSKVYQGQSLSDLELDSYTVTEILRLYLLSSARRGRSENRLWRFQQLGGYQFFDDAPLKLCMEKPELVDKLSRCSVYDLQIGEKLAILKCLMHQFLSNSASRDLLDDKLDHLQQSKTNLREEMQAERRRQREAVSERVRLERLKVTKAEGAAGGKGDEKEAIKAEENSNEKEEGNSEEKPKTVEVFDEEDNQLKEEWEMRDRDLQNEIAHYQCFYRTAVIGKDRYYRRYWSLMWCPAILVEEYEDRDLYEQVLSKHVSTNGTPTDNSTDSTNVLMEQGKRSRWFVYRGVDELKELMSALNSRGFRESKLLENLKHMKKEVVRRLENIRQHKYTKIDLDQLWEAAEGKSAYLPSPASCSIIGFLREHILDFEHKVYEGSLGQPMVSDRPQWRRLIDKGENASHLSILTFDDVQNPAKVEDKFRFSDPCVKSLVIRKEEESKEEEDELVEVVKDLSKSLLCIERGIARRYLKTPLGVPPTTSNMNENVEQMNKRKSEKQINRWEASLLQCTSVSQVFIHLATLEMSVVWSRAVTNAKCRLCRRKGDDASMLLCDMCDRGHHMHCLEPPLKKVPRGDWFCPLCKPLVKKKQKNPKPKKVEEEGEVTESNDESATSTSSTKEAAATSTAVSSSSSRSTRKRGITYKMAEQMELKKLKGRGRAEEDSTDENDGGRKRNHKRSATAPSRHAPSSKRARTSTITTPRSTTSSSTSSSSTAIKPSRSSSRRSESALASKLSNGTNSRKKKTASSSSFSSAMGESDSSSVEDFQRLSKRQRLSNQNKDMKACREIFHELSKHKDAWPFLEPVREKLVPDYYSVITNPMDFSTIRKKFNDIAYSEPSDVLSDIQLIFENCLYYNDRRSEVAKAALSLQQQFKLMAQEKSMGRHMPVAAANNRNRKSR